jgi:hypothetical protein
MDDKMRQAKCGDAGPERQRLYELDIVRFPEQSSGVMDPGNKLKSIREKFTTKSLQRPLKVDGTFVNHSSYNEYFNHYLYLKKPDGVCSGKPHLKLCRRRLKQ